MQIAKDDGELNDAGGITWTHDPSADAPIALWMADNAEDDDTLEALAALAAGVTVQVVLGGGAACLIRLRVLPEPSDDDAVAKVVVEGMKARAPRAVPSRGTYGGAIDLQRLPLRKRLRILARMKRTGGSSVRPVGQRLARWTKNARGEWVEVLGYDLRLYWASDTWEARYPFGMTIPQRRGALARRTRWPSLAGKLP